jgi:hypothetical protein
MPTQTERDYYAAGFRDGIRMSEGDKALGMPWSPSDETPRRKPKRKLSAWNKFVKANSKKPRFRLRSGSPNLKKLAVAFRKTPAGRKKKRR